jgi:uncharacterized protein (TIGR03790 family)
MRFPRLASCFVLLILCSLLGCSGGNAQSRIILPRTGITADEVALLINDDDPLSRQTGAYYQQARQIPEGNVIHLHFPPGKSVLSLQEFEPLKAEIDRLTPSHVQAYAVAWTQPYRVGCMSLTSALAMGFDFKYCSDKCGPTAASGYFNSPSTRPFDDHKLRPAMMLAGTSFERIKALIDRGVAADSSFPEGKAYLLNTSDKARSVRAAHFGLAAKELAGILPIEQLETDAITERKDVLFYFTGLVQVPGLETLSFNPGALADHLTSTGGQLTDSQQMSSLRWLEAGATASYGTVVEPCNHLQKFPIAGVAMFHYALGATAIEAYWKSVAWPGEGVFIGEPLARPFAPLLSYQNGLYELKLISPSTMVWRLEQADSVMGPFQPIARNLNVIRGRNTLRFGLPSDVKANVRLVR